MALKKQIINNILNYITSGSSLRYIIFRFLGFNNYVSLVIKSLDIKGNKTAKKNILCIERTLFEKDVDELSIRIRKYGWIMIKKSQITLYHEEFIPKEFRGQMKFLKHKDKIVDEWKECVNRSKFLLKKLRQEKKVCALMIANIDYWQEHSLQLACKELNIPVIVLSKEYPYSDFYHSDYFKDYFKDFYPIYDALLVFGERLKKIFSELKGFDKDKIFATGAPRIDRWRSMEPFNDKDKSILIFSYLYHATIPSRLKIENPEIDESTESVFFKFLKMISYYAEKNKIKNIIVKTRNKDDYNAIQNYFKKNKINNIELIYEVNNYDLIMQSKIVIGTNSLSIIESMFSKVPIIIPDWFTGLSNQKMFNPNDELCSKALEICKNEESFLKSFDKLISNNITEVNKETHDARIKFVSKFWEYDPEISVSSKVQGVIDKYVEN